MTARQILYHHIAACGPLPLVTVCPDCGKQYWMAWTREQQRVKP